MQHTLSQGDLLFVNKVGPSFARFSSQNFIPARYSLVVFKNPLQNSQGESLVKRVIGLPGERIVLHEGKFTVYSSGQSHGFDPDLSIANLKLPISGEVDRFVPENELFVVGDNREINYSIDSRNGLSTIPLRDIEGIAVWRAWPINSWRLF